jgi:hypothetical protein
VKPLQHTDPATRLLPRSVLLLLLLLLLPAVCCRTQHSWEEGAFERSKAAYINAGASVGKSLERATCSKITTAMLGPDPRFR